MSKILCVDDDKDILELLIFTLTGAGFEVVPVSNPKDALAYSVKLCK